MIVACLEVEEGEGGDVDGREETCWIVFLVKVKGKDTEVLIISKESL